MTVITSDYKKKMKNLVSDKAYKKLDKNPTKTIAQNILDPRGEKQHSQ